MTRNNTMESMEADNVGLEAVSDASKQIAKGESIDDAWAMAAIAAAYWPLDDRLANCSVPEILETKSTEQDLCTRRNIIREIDGSPILIDEMGNEYPTFYLVPPCTSFEVKVLLQEGDLRQLMRFIACAVMESDRCRLFREGEEEKNYEILRKTYAIMGSCAGMKGWDMMPLRHFTYVTRLVDMWCRGMYAFIRHVVELTNCYITQDLDVLREQSKNVCDM